MDSIHRDGIPDIGTNGSHLMVAIIHPGLQKKRFDANSNQGQIQHEV